MNLLSSLPRAPSFTASSSSLTSSKPAPSLTTLSPTPMQISPASSFHSADSKEETPDPCSGVKEALDGLETCSIGYELDCRGWCEMPARFYASSPQVTSSPTPPEIFTCRILLPGSCECDTVFDCEIDFSLKAEKKQRRLKLKSGVYSESWCANNDKIDVYESTGAAEKHLGFVAMKARYCGCMWEIHDAKGVTTYTIKQNKSLFCPCSRAEAEFSIEGAGKGNIRKKLSCCCVNRSNPDDCVVQFPKEADWVAKALIVSAAIWLYKDLFLKNACVL